MSNSGVQFNFPRIPCPVGNFLDHVEENPALPIRQLLQPFQAWEGTLRSVFAQDPDNEIVQDNIVNLIDIFHNDNQKKARIRGRKLDTETKEERERYVMPLEEEERKADGQPAVASSLEEFRKNFNIFTENAFQSFDWSNVVVAGSAVSTTLAPVPDPYASSVRSKREYYHEKVAPASDIDLFIYGIDDEKAAIERMIAIEKDICDNFLQETVTIRTKNCVTIVSRYPNRHIQIVLRLYKSISQILTGFDVNCSCVAYNGSTVFASPRALSAFMTQCNDLDLSRRSPSYESRLSKYSHRGFEVYCDFLDRSKIDPTIFERSFGRTVGLARLLVLERLPKPTDREEYIDKRRVERGGVARVTRRYRRRDVKNLKGNLDDEIPEWQFEEATSSYNTFTIPYGKAYSAKAIERLFYAKDILLNAEWNENNRPPIREVKLHRHPVFLGTVAQVAEDCCGFCPVPETDEEKTVFEEESKLYVSGPITFLKDDPGRQEIGSFYPLDANDYTDMAYISNAETLFRAIVDDDVTKVKEYLSYPDVNVNCRDQCGRTPLHVAAMSSNSLEIFQALIDNGARMIARLQDGRTALHVAAARGQNDFVSALLRKSEANEEEKLEKEDMQRLSAKSNQEKPQTECREEDSGDVEMSDSEDYDGSEDFEGTSAAHSFVKIKRKETERNDHVLEENPEEPDILDINVLDWYFGMAPLHHAILLGSDTQETVIETLISSFGADTLIPVKSKINPEGQEKLILTLTLPLTLPSKTKVLSVLKTLLQCGASCAQASSDNKATAFHHSVAIDRVYNDRLSGISPTEVIDVIMDIDGAAARGVINSLMLSSLVSQYPFGASWGEQGTESPLMTAIELRDESAVLKLLQNGASPVVTLQDVTALLGTDNSRSVPLKDEWVCGVKQPLERAIWRRLDVIKPLLDAGADPSTIIHGTYVDRSNGSYGRRQTVLDLVQDGIKNIKSYVEKLTPLKSPQSELQIDASAYEKFPADSYQRFFAQAQAESHNSLKTNYGTHLDQHKKLQEEREALLEEIEETVLFLKRAEEYLINQGSKPYYELYPDEESRWLKRVPHYEHQQETNKPWEPKHYFGSGNVNDEAYLELFEAAWSGDMETVKKLTLDAYADPESEPLLVSTCEHAGDRNYLNPFYIAVTRGHMDLAKAIFAIAQAQYAPKDLRKYRYSLDEHGSGIVKEVINEASVITNITSQSQKAVKSDISPLSMMTMARGLDEGVSQNTVAWAIRNNKHDVLHNLLELAATFEEDGQWRLINPQLTYPNSADDSFCTALALGKTSVLETFIKAVGCGFDYGALENEKQAQSTLKPEYYLGLTINGRKRKDWVNSANPHHYYQESKTEKLLNLAVHSGNIDSVHWLLSERPLYCLQEFIRLHPENKRAKILATQPDLEEVVGNAVGLDSNVLPHIVIHGWKKNKSKVVLDFLFSKYPDMLESRSIEGFTPLLFAVYYNNHEAIRYLVAKGADLNATGHGRNILDIACSQCGDRVEKILACLPKDFDIKPMFAQRTSYYNESATIWHQFADNNSYMPGIDYLLRISGGHGLDLFNGGGNLPVHHAINKGRHRLAKLYIKARPDLLYKENAGGKTPFDLASDNFLGHLIRSIGEPTPDYFVAPNRIEQIAFAPQQIYGWNSYGGHMANGGLDEKEWEFTCDVNKTRQLLLDAIKEYPGKRIRVTLNEVNELVHRLANKGKGGEILNKKPVRRFVQRLRGPFGDGGENQSDEGNWRQWLRSYEGVEDENEKENEKMNF